MCCSFYHIKLFISSDSFFGRQKRCINEESCHTPNVIKSLRLFINNFRSDFRLLLQFLKTIFPETHRPKTSSENTFRKNVLDPYAQCILFLIAFLTTKCFLKNRTNCNRPPEVNIVQSNPLKKFWKVKGGQKVSRTSLVPALSAYLKNDSYVSHKRLSNKIFKILQV